MSFDWKEFGSTLRDDTFATWFGWLLGVAVVILPLSFTIQSCWSDSTRESIELAKLRATSGQQEAPKIDREALHTETLKWMVARGVHPLVARCALREGDSTTCNDLIGKLGEEERSTIQAMLANPFVEEVAGTAAVVGLKPKRLTDAELTSGADFGTHSAVNNNMRP